MKWAIQHFPPERVNETSIEASSPEENEGGSRGDGCLVAYQHPLAEDLERQGEQKYSQQEQWWHLGVRGSGSGVRIPVLQLCLCQL